MIAAFVLHLALPVAAAIAPEPFWRRVGIAPAPQPTEIDVDVSQLPDEHPPEAHEDAAIGDGRTAVNERRTDRTPRRDRAQPSHGDDVEPPEPIVNGADDSPDSFPSAEPDARPDPMHTPPSLHEVGGPGAPGSMGLPPGVLPPDTGGDHGAAPTKTRKRTYDKDAARASIDKGMRHKDAQLGLDFPAAAAIAAALVEGVRSSDAPDECRGSFGVSVSPAGKVTGIGVGGFTGGDAATWNMAKKTALALLSSRIFEMKSSFAKGATVSVTVVSQRKMPGGGVGRTGTTFSFDVADIGAKPVRVVSSSFSAKPVE
jgi:hypothetical protein